MLRRKPVIAALGAILAAALAFTPAAKADRLGFSLSIGGPGYGFAVGNAPYYRGYGPYRSYGYRPYPAYYGGYVAPPVVYRAPVYYAPAYAYPAPYPYPYSYYGGRGYYRY